MIGEVTVTQTRQAGQPDNEKSTGIFLFSARLLRALLRAATSQLEDLLANLI